MATDTKADEEPKPEGGMLGGTFTREPEPVPHAEQLQLADALRAKQKPIEDKPTC